MIKNLKSNQIPQGTKEVQVFEDAKIRLIGKHTYDMTKMRIYADKVHGNLYIGSFCSISHNCTIYLGGDHNTKWITTYPFGHEKRDVFNKFNGVGHPVTKGDVVIGNDVWIAGNVTIMSGVKIGDGAIIGNNSHVVKDIEPYTIVGGNPARYIKHRFSLEQIDKLLKIKWWDWDDDKINEATPLLCSENIETFINKYA